MSQFALFMYYLYATIQSNFFVTMIYEFVMNLPRYLHSNSLMHNVPKWSDILLKSYSKCCKIFKVCLAILRHYALKG